MPSRHDLRQEPDAVTLLVRICAGGGQFGDIPLQSEGWAKSPTGFNHVPQVYLVWSYHCRFGWRIW